MQILVEAEISITMSVAKPSSRGVTALSMCITVARDHFTDGKIFVDQHKCQTTHQKTKHPLQLSVDDAILPLCGRVASSLMMAFFQGSRFKVCMCEQPHHSEKW